MVVFSGVITACSAVCVKVMMGGAWFEQTFGSPDLVTEQTLLDRAVHAVNSHLSVTSQPVWSCVALLKVRLCAEIKQIRYYKQINIFFQR